jgi:putative ABC transport system substrate-binding protein
MIKRREFITLLGGAAVWPVAARAQRGDRMRRIGVLMGRPASDSEGQKQTAALQRGLEELGWLSGRNIQIDYRWQTDDKDQLQAFAKELIC